MLNGLLPPQASGAIEGRAIQQAFPLHASLVLGRGGGVGRWISEFGGEGSGGSWPFFCGLFPMDLSCPGGDVGG